ncbi:MAG: hypothetical protein DMF89_26665, partial [Acidobacteria bacterium]
IAADAAGNVFIGGDSHPDNNGNLYWWNNRPAANGGQVWEPIVLGNANGTAPHADSRAMVFDRFGDLLEGDDGGLYRLIAPTQPTLRGNPRLTFNNANHTIARDAGSWRDDGFDVGQQITIAGPPAGANAGTYTIENVATTVTPDDTLTLTRGAALTPLGPAVNGIAVTAVRRWENLNSSLRVTEMLSAAYDPLNNVIFGGSQDNGVAEQPPAADGVDNDGDGLIDEADERFAWQQVVVAIRPGDGNTTAAVPLNSDADPQFDQVRRYTMSNSLRTLGSRIFDANGQMVPGTDNLVLLRGARTDTLNFAAANVNPGTDQIAIAVHGLVDGAGPFWVDSDGTLPGGLFASAQYWVHVVDPNNIQLATSRGAAVAATVVNITTPGSGADTLNNRFNGLDLADRNTFTAGFHRIPYVVNAVDSTRMLIGLRALYGSTSIGAPMAPQYDGLDTVSRIWLPPERAGVFFSALAYGGRKGGIGQANVVYAARGNEIFVALPTGGGALGAFQTERIDQVVQIRDLVLDPDNYDTAYAVADSGVYKRTAPNKWVLISEQLNNADLQTIEFVNVGGQQVLLVGGATGVYRAFDPGPGAIWTEFGRGLPNALVTDLSFIHRPAAAFENPHGLPRGDVLLAATLGRGAWTIQNADTFLDDRSVITIQGTAVRDIIELGRNAAKPSLLDVIVNGNIAISVPLSSVGKIEFFGGDGNDQLTVNSALGPISVPEGIVFHGGDGNMDELFVKGSKVHEVSQESPVAGQTKITIEDTRGGDKEVITYDIAVEKPQNQLDEASTLEKLGDWFRRFFRFLTFWLDDPGAGAQKELAIIGGSLPRALKGVSVGRPQPIADRDAGVEEEGVTELNLNLDDVPGLERIIESGPNGFSLADIGTLISTPQQLRDRLDDLDSTPGNVTLTQSEGVTRFDAQVIRRLSGVADFGVGTAVLGGAIDLSGQVEIGADVELDLAFGVDAGGVFIDTNGAGSRLVVRNISVDGPFAARGQFGFLDVAVENPTLTIAPQVQLSVKLQDPSGEGKIRLAELAATLLNPATLPKLATLTISGAPGDDVALDVKARAAAILPFMDAPFDLGDARFTATWPDITDIGAVNIQFSGSAGETLRRFLTVNTGTILGKLKELRDSFKTLGMDAPLISDAFDRVIDFTEAFDRNIIQPLTSSFSGSSNFRTIQDMVEQVTRSLGADLDKLGIDFDLSSRELTFPVHLAEAIEGTRHFDFGSAINLDVTGKLQASVNLDFVAGIDLDDLIAGNPADALFIKDARARGAANLAATNVTAAGNFDFLNVAVTGGSAQASLALDVTLNDPNSDGRITLNEILTNLAGVFGSPTFTGSAAFNLPVALTFRVSGVALSGNLRIAVDATNLAAPIIKITGTGATLNVAGQSLVGDFAIESVTTAAGDTVDRIGISNATLNIGSGIVQATISQGSALVTASSVGASFTGSAAFAVTGFSISVPSVEVEINSGTAAIHDTFTIGGNPRTTIALNLPAGPFIRVVAVVADANPIDIAGNKLSGTFAFDQQTRAGPDGAINLASRTDPVNADNEVVTRIVMSDVKVTLSGSTDPTLKAGTGAFVVTPTGVAGFLSGTAALASSG